MEMKTEKVGLSRPLLLGAVAVQGPGVGEDMITRSNLAEQLRDYQLRSQHNWSTLSLFSSNVHISSREDAAKAGLLGLLFLSLLVFSFVALYLKYAWLALIFLCIAIVLLICLKIIRQNKINRKRQRRMLLPLSM